MKIQLDIRCETCDHLEHSGAFTPGGAKDICGHGGAPPLFYPGGPKAFDEAIESRMREYYATGKDSVQHHPSHWIFRVVDVSTPEPPAQCPLRKFEVK